MWGGGITEADGIDVVFVVYELENGFPSLEIENNDRVFGSPGNDFTAVTREAQTPDAEACMTPM